MPQFSSTSKNKLSQCDKRLQKIFNEVIKYRDCTIIEGHRNKETQNEYFRTGKSKVQWPDGKHNSIPSKAVDAGPYIPGKKIPWKNPIYFYMFAGYVLAVADSMGIQLRWGGDWDGDTDLDDQNFNDLVHFELQEK